MSSYNREELRQLIETYNNKLIAQYDEYTQSNVKPNISENDNVTLPIQTNITTNSDLTDIGQLQIRVSTENQAVPIEGAVIMISHQDDYGTQLDYTLISDQSGLSEIIDLPTKDRNLSLSPDNSSPFATYTIEINADGYIPKRFINVPIYGGVIAIQNVSMIPFPEAAGNDMLIERDEGMYTL